MSAEVMENTFLDKLNKLYLYSKSIVDNKNITSTTVILLTNKLIQIVEKYKDLTGAQKKMLVLDTLSKLINEYIDDASVKQELLTLITIIVPKIIDTVVYAINGEMKFTKDIKHSFFSVLCPCFSKKNTKKKSNEITNKDESLV
jgi:hypothetical protein